VSYLVASTCALRLGEWRRCCNESKAELEELKGNVRGGMKKKKEKKTYLKIVQELGTARTVKFRLTRFTAQQRRVRGEGRKRFRWR
jgi:hypothetical protein